MDNAPSHSRQANSEEAVADAIRRMIVESRFDEDERITESNLSRKLGASRTPVRMALKLLHAEGMLVKLEGRGYRAGCSVKKRMFTPPRFAAYWKDSPPSGWPATDCHR